MATVKAAGQLKLEAGRLCLDFANTLDWHASEHPIEKLKTYADLVAWAKTIGLVSERAAKHLIEQAGRHPRTAGAALDKARTLREATYAIFVAVAHGGTPQQADIDIVNATLAEMLSRSRLVPSDAGFVWDWGGGEDDLDQILWWIVQSATDVLTSDELKRVGQCADEHGCGWLFFDTSKNRTRRWCDMRGCGNRAKARRHYEKERAEAV
jgi:predicted RNA-binding Zn ribbon-like protein